MRFSCGFTVSIIAFIFIVFFVMVVIRFFRGCWLEFFRCFMIFSLFVLEGGGEKGWG